MTLGNALHPMQKTTEQITMGASNNFHSKSRAYKWKQYFILHLISPCPSSSAILPKPTPVKKKWKKKNTKDLSDLSKPFLLLEKKRQRDRQTDRQTETEKKGEKKNTHKKKKRESKNPGASDQAENEHNDTLTLQVSWAKWFYTKISFCFVLLFHYLYL